MQVHLAFLCDDYFILVLSEASSTCWAHGTAIPTPGVYTHPCVLRRALGVGREQLTIIATKYSMPAFMFSNITSCQVWEASSVPNTQTDSTRTAQMETELARTEVDQHSRSFRGRTRWPQHTRPGRLGFRIKDDFAFHYWRNLSKRVVLRTQTELSPASLGRDSREGAVKDVGTHW